MFFTDPELDDLEIQRFAPDNINDDYSNTAWTLEGRIGFLAAVYTGAFTDRDTDQTVDYTDYLFVDQYLPYYICGNSVVYPGAGAPSGTCPAPNLFVNSTTDTQIQTHELRFNTPVQHRLRATVGGFYSDLELEELNDFNYPGSVFVTGVDGVTTGFAPDNPFGAPDTASTDGFIFKGNVSWTPTDDLLFYFTYSEGFRPGLLNRPGGAAGPNGFVVPFALETDDVQNYEIGWKTTLFNQLQFNGSAFFVDISDLQTTIFDPAITNLFFSDDAADAELYGLEADVIWAPPQIEGLTVTAAMSLLDTEITEVRTPTDDVIEGDELAFAPNFQGNLRARYEWDPPDSKYRAHVQGQGVYSASSFSDIVTINRTDIDNWFTLAFAGGVTTEKWSAEFIVENVTDERAELGAQKDICTPELFTRQAGKGHDARDPIFTVGLPRASSTLIEQILASHSQVDGTLELPDILSLAHRLRGRKHLSSKNRYPQILHELSADELSALGREYCSSTQIHRRWRGRTERCPRPLAGSFRKPFRHASGVASSHAGLSSGARISSARRRPCSRYRRSGREPALTVLSGHRKPEILSR